MKALRSLAVCGMLIVVWLATATGAAAHSGAPVRSFAVQVGPYPVTIYYWNEPHAGQPLRFTIVPRDGGPATLHYQAEAVPGTTVDAVPVRAQMGPDPDNRYGVAGEVNLPVTGQWLLNIDATGTAGPGSGDAPIVAASPVVMPEWLGWVIGLLPVWAMLGFIIVQARRAGPRALRVTPLPV